MRSRPPIHLLRLLLLGALLQGCSRKAPPPATSAAPDTTRVLRQRIAALEGVRSFGDGELFARITHPDPRVRAAAALALGRIQDAQAARPLLPLLDDPDSTVVEQASWALRQLQGCDESTRFAIEAALVTKLDSGPGLRASGFLEAIRPYATTASLGTIGKWVVAGMLAGMGSEARDPVVEGMAALAVASVDNDRRLKVLHSMGPLTNRDEPATWRIAEAMTLRPDTLFLPQLVSLTEHSHPYARAAGARALGKLGDARALPALERLLSDLEWKVRASALIALADIGSDEARSYCAAMIGDVHPLVREAALRALEKVGAGSFVPLVRDAVSDSVPAVRLGALRVLAAARDPSAAAAFAAARRDSLDFVRAEALGVARRVLGAEAGLRLLLDTLAGGPPRERAEAAQAFAEAGAELVRGDRPRVQRALVAALADSDFVVVCQAAEALGKLGLAGSAAALAATYSGHQTAHHDVDIRLSAMTALFELSAAKEARSVVADVGARGAADPDVRVAYAARRALARARAEPEPPAPVPQARSTPLPATLPEIDLGRVRVRLVTRHGEAILELDGDGYPRTVGNFLHLIDTGFYRDGVFHRVVPAFVVQGGCPRGDGWGDAGSFIPCEYGTLRYDREGVVGMATSGRDTGGTQFFITHLPVPRLDGHYTAFGRVVHGMDVVDQIVRGDRFRIERIEPATASYQ